MRFKTAKFKAVNASNSTVIAKFTNAEVGCFGCMDHIHELISASQANQPTLFVLCKLKEKVTLMGAMSNMAYLIGNMMMLRSWYKVYLNA